MNLDARTPVIVGVGQASERLGEPGYRGRSAVDLAADAVREALGDAARGSADAIIAAVDTVAGVRQFEISRPPGITPGRAKRTGPTSPSTPRAAWRTAATG